MHKRKDNNMKTIRDEYKEFVYCGMRKCPHVECLRHHKNTPWNEPILITKYKPDADWNCKDMISPH